MSELNKKIDLFLEKANKAFVHPKKFKFLEHDKGLLVTHEESKLRIITGEPSGGLLPKLTVKLLAACSATNYLSMARRCARLGMSLYESNCV